MKDGNKELAPTAIVEGTTVIRSRRQLSQIIDTTLLKCYLKVVNLTFNTALLMFVLSRAMFTCSMLFYMLVAGDGVMHCMM